MIPEAKNKPNLSYFKDKLHVRRAWQLHSHRTLTLLVVYNIMINV